MDTEDPPPINPFNFWKDRMRDHDVHQQENTRRETSSTIQQQISTMQSSKDPILPKKKEESVKESQYTSKRRPPPRPPLAQTLCMEQSSSAPHGIKSSSKEPGVQKRVGKLEAVRDNGDASSYVPGLKRSPMHINTAHKVVKKTNSSPVKPSASANVGSIPYRRSPIKTSSSVDHMSPPKFSHRHIPTIQTIRASIGDRLSVDDLELYKPKKKGAQLEGVQLRRVLDVAKKFDSTFLSVQPPLAAKGRRGSSGDINDRVSRYSGRG